MFTSAKCLVFIALLIVASVYVVLGETNGTARSMLAFYSYKLPAGCSVGLKGLKRASFPAGFTWGMATSAYQVEGASNVGGKGQSIWDVFAHTRGKIADGSNGDVTADQYHHLEEDVRRMQIMGVQSYRFSIAWTRVLPSGEGRISLPGVAYYNRLINALIAAKIKPVATLYHWDFPQGLQAKYGGWLNVESVADFQYYADVCFRLFGNRVKEWITFNEPFETATQGFATGGMAPGRCSNRGSCAAGDSAREPYIVGHHILKAHAAAVFVYRSKYKRTQRGQVGITLDCTYQYPLTKSPNDIGAAQRGMIFAYGWFADPIVRGDYPPIMREYLGSRLPTFTAKEKVAIKGSTDFLGLNFYTAVYASNGGPPGLGSENPYSDPRVSTTGTSANGIPIGASTGSPWLKVVPSAIHDMLQWIAQRYPRIPIIITENGVSDKGDASVSLALCDKQRVSYYSSYLGNVLKAIKSGVNVKGYYAWSFVDNFEWAAGYTQRFGIHYIDFKDPHRTRRPKASASWWYTFLHYQS